MAWGGVGITAHFAFNEPPEPGETMSNEEFANLPTRVLQIARENLTINAFMNCATALRKILHGPITSKIPCSLFQNHPDAKIYAVSVALASPIPEIRIYNK